jgi:hypothetical protein
MAQARPSSASLRASETARNSSSRRLGIPCTCPKCVSMRSQLIISDWPGLPLSEYDVDAAKLRPIGQMRIFKLSNHGFWSTDPI